MAKLTTYSIRFSPARRTGAIDWHGHLNFASWLIENVRPKVFVELGVFRGDSLATFAQSAREQSLGCEMFGVDTWRGDDTTGQYDDVFPEVKDYFDVNHPSVRLMRCLFDDALASFADGSIDLLHIDGCHHYDAVKHDYETWKPKMSDRGIILFHDVEATGAGFGTHRFWREIRDTYPSFSFNHSNGLGVLMVGKDQPDCLKQLVASPADVDLFRAVFEACGARFFYEAKMNWWRGEAGHHAAEASALQSALQQQSQCQSVMARIKRRLLG